MAQAARGVDDADQQNKGAMAIGTGGLTGTGLFTPEHIFVPNAWNDFIFAYLANVLGFVGAAAVLALLLASVLTYGRPGALVLQARYLLLDEPTAGLDPRGRAQMIAIIRRIVEQGRHVVISSHDIDLIYEVSDAVYVLRHGEVLAAGDPGEVFACAETMDRAGLTQPWLVKLHSELGLPLCKTEAEFFQRMHNNAIGAIKEAS